MEDDLNGRRPQWKTTSMEYKLNGRQPQWEKCALPKLNKTASMKISSLRENSFQVHGPKLFNCLPAKLRNIEKCTVDEFKLQLDLILAQVPDEPKVTGSEYTPTACDLYTGNPSNSIIDQIRNFSFSSARRNPGS